MQNLEPHPILENQTHKLLWDFEMKTYYQISIRWPDKKKKKEKKKRKERESAE